MNYKLWFENVIEMKMKCKDLILFLAGFVVVVAYGKFYKLIVPCPYPKRNKWQKGSFLDKTAY